jgi:hypothetical protein
MSLWPPVLVLGMGALAHTLRADANSTWEPDTHCQPTASEIRTRRNQIAAGLRGSNADLGALALATWIYEPRRGGVRHWQ